MGKKGSTTKNERKIKKKSKIKEKDIRKARYKNKKRRTRTFHK